MAADPLAKFRPTTSPVTGASDTRVAAHVYEAFKAVDRRQLRLHVRPSNGAWERLPYPYLHRIIEDGEFGTEIVLVYQFLVVVILGHNLCPIAEAIEAERCEFVQDYMASKWTKPTDPTAPIIDSITIYDQKPPAQVLADLEAKAATAQQ